MIFNYNKLRGRIIEKYNKLSSFAMALGISNTALSFRLGNKVFFSQSEITRIVELLEIPIEEIHYYFFDVEVAREETV